MQDSFSLFLEPEDSLTSMLLQKEKELQELSKLRIGQLQDELGFRDKKIFDLESQIRRLIDDNTYKSSLLQQREDEIKELEGFIREKLGTEAALEDLKFQCMELKSRLNEAEESKFENTEYKENHKEMQEKLQEAYSMINKLKYEGQFNNEQARELEQKFKELEGVKFQYEEEIKSKDLLIQKLLGNIQSYEAEINSLNSKLRNERERCERELAIMKNKYSNEVRSIKEIKDNSTEQISFSHKIQIEKLQGQLKSLLDDNKKANGQVEYYQNLMLDKEKALNHEIYSLRKDVTYKTQQAEELQASVRAKEMEIDSVKEHIDHWKGLAVSRADELFKFKQLQLRSEEKAENYLKELDANKNDSFNEIQRLKRELDKFIKEKKERLFEETEGTKRIVQYKDEIEKLNDLVYNKEKEIARLAMLVESLRKTSKRDNSKTQHVPDFEGTNCDAAYDKPKSRDFSSTRPGRGKINSIKSKLDEKFLKLSNVKF